MIENGYCAVMQAPNVLVTFRTKRTSVCIEAAAGERILYAGLRNGLDLPYECVSGNCGTCQAMPLNAPDGAIENLFLEAPAARKLPAGQARILMCQSVACRNVELRLFSQVDALGEDQVKPDYLRGALVSIDSIARDTIAFSVEAERTLDYRAGQFVTVAIDAVKGHRAYSMHKAPNGRRLLDFVVKLKPQGAFSRQLAGEARAGSPVQLFGPLGRAVLRPDDPTKLFGIAGGSGIAGIIPIFEQSLASETDYSANLVFGVRTLADAFFLDRLDALAGGSNGRFDVTVAISHEPCAPRNEQFPRLKFDAGFAVEVAKCALSKRSDRLQMCFFLAGPSPMVESGIAMLHEEFKIDSQRIRFDRFQ